MTKEIKLPPLPEPDIRMHGKKKRGISENWIGAYTTETVERLRREAIEAYKAQQHGKTMRATGWLAPKDRYVIPVLFDPYTGEPRDVRDVQSDPQGILIAVPGQVEMVAAPAQQQGSVTIPATADEAALMVLTGTAWLKYNAPDRLTHPAPAQQPLTDEVIRGMCKETWVFDTVKQWVRIIEAAHNIGT